MIFSQLRKNAIERVLLYSRGQELHLDEGGEKRRVGVVLFAARTRNGSRGNEPKSQSFSVFHHFCVFCGAYEKEVMTRLEVHFEALCCL
jgi:hypothetical protein